MGEVMNLQLGETGNPIENIQLVMTFSAPITKIHHVIIKKCMEC